LTIHTGKIRLSLIALFEVDGLTLIEERLELIFTSWDLGRVLKQVKHGAPGPAGDKDGTRPYFKEFIASINLKKETAPQAQRINALSFDHLLEIPGRQSTPARAQRGRARCWSGSRKKHVWHRDIFSSVSEIDSARQDARLGSAADQRAIVRPAARDPGSSP
jgi:hypothetical protein